MEAKLLTLAEACSILRITDATAYRWRKRGYGPQMVLIGSRQYYKRAEIEAFIEGAVPGTASARKRVSIAQ